MRSRPAEIVAAEIGYRDRIAVTDLLVPEGTASRVVAFLRSTGRQLEETPSIALVAHEPILSALAAALIGKPRHPPLRKTEALRIRLGSGARRKRDPALAGRRPGPSGAAMRNRPLGLK